jgi:hypothetical protein
MADNIEVISNENFFTVVVDPNGINKDNVTPEDLFIYVDFRALPKSRSVIETDGTYYSEFFEKKGISFIASTEQNGKGYLTTNYTNIGGTSPTEKEAFGIESISMEYGASLAPTFKIKFIDVRGAGLFNGYERVDAEGNLYNNSEFAVFFSLPYPLFQLTIKGYYGKAVTYCLHLMNYNASFDSETGNFVIDATFQGYTFAFLTDILLGYVMALNSTEIGTKQLESRNIPSISKFIGSLGQLTRITEKFKSDDKSYLELKYINSLLFQVDKIIKVIGLPMTKSNYSSFGNPLLIPQLKQNVDQAFVRDVGIFSEERRATHIQIVEDIEKFIKEYNDFIAKNLSTYAYSNEYKIDKFDVKTPQLAYSIDSNFATIITNEALKDGLSNDPNIITADALRSRLNLPVNTAKKFFLVNYHEFRKEISELFEDLKKKKADVEVVVNQNLNKELAKELGFDLSIQNVFNILIGNVESFLEIVYAISVAADNPDIQSGRLVGLRNTRSDIPNSINRIYPFPAVFNAVGEEIWLGDLVGEENPNFPELQLVKQVLNSMLASNNQVTNSNEQKVYQNTVGISGDSWVPVSPTDISAPYVNINNVSSAGTVLPESFYIEIIDRILKAYNSNNYSNSTINYISQFEAAYAFFKTNEATIKNVLNNVDKAVFVSSALSAVNSNNGYIVDGAGIRKTSNESVLIGSSEGFGDDSEIKKLLTSGKRNLVQTVSKSIESTKLSIEDILIPTNLKDLHRQVDKNSYTVKGDLSPILWDGNVLKNISKFYKSKTSNDLDKKKSYYAPIISIITDLAIFDGRLNSSTDFTETDAKYSNLSRDNIAFGLLSFDGKKFLLDTPYYTFAESEEAAYLFLHSLPFSNISSFYKAFDVGGSVKIGELQMAWVAAQFWLAVYKKSNNSDFLSGLLNRMISNGAIASNEIAIYSSEFSKLSLEFNKDLPFLEDFEPSFVQKMVKWYQDWVSKVYIPIPDITLSEESINNAVESRIGNYNKFYGLGGGSSTSAYHQAFRASYDEILELFTTTIDLVIIDRNSIFSQKKYMSEATLEESIIKWIATYKKIILENGNGGYSTNININDFPAQPYNTNDKDLKIATYRHLKTLYDKWIAGSRDGKVFNACSFGGTLNNGKSLIDRFHFVDKAFRPIGNEAIINPKPLMVLSEQPDINLYTLIGSLTRDSGFDFHVLPSWVNYKNPVEASEMWKPQTTIDNSNSGASYICMYVGGSSKVLDLGKNSLYANDGFDLRTYDFESIPEGFKNRIPINTQNVPTDKDKYNMVAFRVGYADQNQGIFKGIALNQEEHRETAESIQATTDAIDNRGGTKRMYKGVNLYNIYAIRSYKCTVRSMGNMMVHPLNYFQLDNVPFFHGAYLITSVKHDITAHNVETEFSGLRMPRFNFPIVNSATTYVNIPLSDTLFSIEEQNRSILRPLGGESYSEPEINEKKKPAKNGGIIGGALDYIGGLFGNSSTSVPSTVTEIVTDLNNKEIILDSELSGLSNNQMSLIPGYVPFISKSNLDRGGLWATAPISKVLALDINISDTEYTKLIQKNKNPDTSASNIQIATRQVVASSKFNVFDKYISTKRGTGYLRGKSRVARPLGTKTEMDKVYGFVDASKMPEWPLKSGVSLDPNDPTRIAFMNQNIAIFNSPYELKIPLGNLKNGRFQYTQGSKKMYLHRSVGDSLVVALKEVLDFYGIDNIKALGLDIWAGSFVWRQQTRSKGVPSTHAYGVAVDFGSISNAYEWTGKNNDALFSQDIYIPFLDILEKYGWYNNGRYYGLDWMHFQAVCY